MFVYELDENCSGKHIWLVSCQRNENKSNALCEILDVPLGLAVLGTLRKVMK